MPKSTSLRKRYVVEIRFAEVFSGLGSSLGSKDRDRTIVSSESKNQSEIFARWRYSDAERLRELESKPGGTGIVSSLSSGYVLLLKEQSCWTFLHGE